MKKVSNSANKNDKSVKLLPSRGLGGPNATRILSETVVRLGGYLTETIKYQIYYIYNYHTEGQRRAMQG